MDGGHGLGVPLWEAMGKSPGIKCEGTCPSGGIVLCSAELTVSPPFPGAEGTAVPSRQGGGLRHMLGGIPWQ